MDGACSHAFISRKRKREPKQKNRQMNVGIEDLGDDCIINILSCMSMKEAARTSVLSQRWRYLWTSAFGTLLEFNDKLDTDGRMYMKKKKFKRMVNAALLNHQQDRINGLIIHFNISMRKNRRISRTIESWISFAIRKEVRRMELEFSRFRPYKFPLMLLLSSDVPSPPAFRFLQSLRFTNIDIEDKVIDYFLGSCPNLEELRIRSSSVTKHIVYRDPIPCLKTLEITYCWQVRSLELCAPNLVSFVSDSIFLPKTGKFPSLSEVTLSVFLTDSFIFEPHLHSNYSVQLVKLRLQITEVAQGRASIAIPRHLPQLCSLKRLELQTVTPVGRSHLFFALLIKASPLLREFRFEILYEAYPNAQVMEEFPYPAVRAVDAVKIVHDNLKVFEMVGYIGCSSDDEFLCHLFKIAPTLEMVVIDTQSVYYAEIEGALVEKEEREEELYAWDDWPEVGARTRIESKERAAHFITSHNHLSQQIKFLIK